MTVTINGSPFTKIGEALGNCDNADLSSQPYCTECRQFKKWTERVVHWFKGDGESRIGAILRAILEGHDDILKAFCQNCWVAETETCDCFVSKYKSVGLSLTINVLTGYDDCLRLGNPMQFTRCGTTDDWFYECTPQMCEVCTERVLDPCNDANDEAIARKLYEAEIFRVTHRPTGDNILAQVARLFTGSTPVFAGISEGVAWVYLGRAMTPEEVQLRELYLSMIPVPDFGQVRLVEPAV